MTDRKRTTAIQARATEQEKRLPDLALRQENKLHVKYRF